MQGPVPILQRAIGPRSEEGRLARTMVQDPKHILIVKLSSMGDVLHTLPALCALRDRFPAASITWLVDARFAGLLSGHPAIDDIVIARAPAWTTKAGPVDHLLRAAFQYSAIRDLRRRHFDVVFDFQGLFRSGIFSVGSGASRRIGFRQAREAAWIFYTKTVDAPKQEHAVARNLKLIEPWTGKLKKVRFDLPVDAAARESAQLLLARLGITPQTPIVTMATRSSRAAKNWTAAGFAAVANHLVDRKGARCLAVGAPADREFCEEIRQLSNGRVDVVTEQPLAVTAALFQRSRLAIGLDSGPVHIASAVGVPVVSIFGPTDPKRFSPWGSEHLVVRKTDNCRACRLGFSSSRTVAGVPHTCLRDLPADLVIKKIDEVWSQIARDVA